MLLLIENYKRNITGRTFLFALTELVFRVTRTHIYTFKLILYIYTFIRTKSSGRDRLTKGVASAQKGFAPGRGERECFIHAAYLAGTFELFATTTAAVTTI